MTDIAARIAAAAGDATALLALTIELAQENAQLAERAAVLDRRRKKDADRKRTTPRNSEEIHGEPRTSADVRGNPSVPSSPAPSLLPPTPPNNPSSPPSPASPSSAPADPAMLEAEQRLLARLDHAGVTIVQRFLGRAGSEARRAAWVGRLGALMDDRPNFTPGELAEGLEALMTEPEDTWKPSVLKAWVRRVRSDAQRERERQAQGQPERPAGRLLAIAGGVRSRDAQLGEAGELVSRIRQLIRTTDVPGASTNRYILAADVKALGDDVWRAYDHVGGSGRFLALDRKPEDISFLVRDFSLQLERARTTPAGVDSPVTAAVG